VEALVKIFVFFGIVIPGLLFALIIAFFPAVRKKVQNANNDEDVAAPSLPCKPRISLYKTIGTVFIAMLALVLFFILMIFMVLIPVHLFSAGSANISVGKIIAYLILSIVPCLATWHFFLCMKKHLR
jgi:hypothetical protein